MRASHKPKTTTTTSSSRARAQRSESFSSSSSSSSSASSSSNLLFLSPSRLASERSRRYEGANFYLSRRLRESAAVACQEGCAVRSRGNGDSASSRRRETNDGNELERRLVRHTGELAPKRGAVILSARWIVYMRICLAATRAPACQPAVYRNMKSCGERVRLFAGPAFDGFSALGHANQLHSVAEIRRRRTMIPRRAAANQSHTHAGNAICEHSNVSRNRMSIKLVRLLGSKLSSSLFGISNNGATHLLSALDPASGTSLPRSASARRAARRGHNFAAAAAR